MDHSMRPMSMDYACSLAKLDGVTIEYGNECLLICAH